MSLRLCYRALLIVALVPIFLSEYRFLTLKFTEKPYKTCVMAVKFRDILLRELSRYCVA